jgi:hypothetical protein
MHKSNDELRRAGEFVAAEGLADPGQAKTVRFDGGTPVATDGPFAEAKESLAGWWIIALSFAANTFAIIRGQKVPLGTDEADLPLTEGFFTHKQTGERVFQSAITNDPDRRIAEVASK